MRKVFIILIILTAAVIFNTTAFAAQKGPVGGNQHYGNVAVVAQNGGDYADPVAAMESIAQWCGTPSAGKPCLVKIMPGVYNIGENILQMQSYVDIEGSGENTTKITGTGGGPFSSVVSGATHSDIRLLTVENNVGIYSPFCACVEGTGILNWDASSNIADVSVIVSGATQSSCGIRYINAPSTKATNVTVSVSNTLFAIGLFSQDGSSVTLENVAIDAAGEIIANGITNDRLSNMKIDDLIINAVVSGYEVLSAIGIQQGDNSRMEMNNAVITASGSDYDEGFNNQPTSVTKISNSSITATYSIENYGKIYIKNSELNGTILAYDGKLECKKTFDASHNPITCP